MIDIEDIKSYFVIAGIISLAIIGWIAIIKAISIVCDWLDIEYIFVF